MAPSSNIKFLTGKSQTGHFYTRNKECKYLSNATFWGTSIRLLLLSTLNYFLQAKLENCQAAHMGDLGDLLVGQMRYNGVAPYHSGANTTFTQLACSNRQLTPLQ